MSNFDSSKNLAGIGALLFAIGGVVPNWGVIVSIIGAILMLMGIKGLAEYYNDPPIYQNALRGVIFAIIAIVALTVGALGSIGLLSVSLLALVGVVVGAIIAFVFYILAARSLRITFNKLAEKSGNGMFRTAGTLLFIGAILTIIVVGIFLIFVAWILALIAFFSMNASNQPAPSTGYTPPPAGSPTGTTRYCSSCGAPNTDPNAQFCQHCGKQLT